MMNDDLVAQIDEAAQVLNISRSAFICMSVSQKMQQDNIFASLPDMMDFIKRANNGEFLQPTLDAGKQVLK